MTYPKNWRVSPAHAGMDPTSWALTYQADGFPRTRGDGDSVFNEEAQSVRFPPHTRGWTLHVEDDGIGTRVSPAHAGMDLLCALSQCRLRGFPRTRGDGPFHTRSWTVSASFPPHTRGWTALRLRCLPSLEVSPAHAGMDLLCALSQCRLRGFPRTRGDGPCLHHDRVTVFSFPPHTRGWTWTVPY